MSYLKRELGLFDVTNLVIGTIVGADIYIAAAFGASYLGPSSIFAWLIAGIMAVVIALCFAECSSLLPKVGGPYAYAKDAFGDFTGFMVGWSLLIASWAAISVFPLAFVSYLLYFYPAMPLWLQTLVKIIFVIFLTIINYYGVKEAGKVNDILTLLKLAPILLFTLFGIIYFLFNPAVFVSNFTPLAPMGLGSMGSALVLIFWAYVGFELVTVPSDEIKDSKKTIPKAIILGMSGIMLFYLVTNLVILGSVPWMQLANSSAPLSLAGSALLGGLGAILLTVGALFSISGSDEAGILSSARIPYAMAGDGLLPSKFAAIHPEYGTPYVALYVQSVVTLLAAIFGSISQLIVLSVFTLLFCYLITCLAVFPLKKKYTGGIKLPWIVPVIGVIISLYMMTQCNINQIITGLLFMGLGVPIFIKYAPRNEIQRVKKDIELGRGIFARWLRIPDRFLAYFLRRLAYLVRKIRSYL